MTIRPGMRMPDYQATGNGKAKSARQLANDPGLMGDALKESEGTINATIILVLATRGAIFFGMPKNGTAVLIRAWVGGEKYEDYCNSREEIGATLEALRDAAEAALMR